MILFLTLLYIGLLLLLIKLGKLPNSKTVWLTLIPYELVLLIGFFIPMQWGAPAGPVMVVTYSVPVTPNVAGSVIEVPVKPNEPIRKDDVLFRIDPVPFQAAFDGLKAQLKLAELRHKQSSSLVSQNAGSANEVEAYEAEVAGLKAKIDNAEYNLRETVVRAPADGFVTNVTLRPGARVVTFPIAPAMAFIDTSETGVVAQIHQIYTRFIEAGLDAEVTFKTRPGKVYTARVRYLIPVTAQGQSRDGGFAAQPNINFAPGPFFVRLDLDDQELASELVPGTVGSVAIYTSSGKFTHVIRKVMIRIEAIVNYFNPA